MTKKLSDDDLVAFWNNMNMRMIDIVHATGEKEANIQRAWRGLKRSGRIPTVRRPVIPAPTWPARVVLLKDVDEEEAHNFCARTASDELLELLREHHGPAGRPDIPEQLKERQ